MRRSRRTSTGDRINTVQSGHHTLAPRIGREMPGGFVQFDAENIQEAVDVCEQLRSTGRYIYFRGQRDARWRVTSSLARQSPEGRLIAAEEISRFAGWVHEADQVVPYLGDHDKIIAAAQHHQVTQTTFIDFSTDPVVAGWFAAEGGIIGDEGAIYLVNPEELEPIFGAVTHSLAVVRFLSVDVANLWRLQAQSGLFLEAQCDIDWIWPLDRIVFAQTGAFPAIEQRDIYPDRRSHLEQMIDNYRNQRALEVGLRSLINTGNVLYYDLGGSEGEKMLELDFVSSERGWSNGPNEHWDDVQIGEPPPYWSVTSIKFKTVELASLIAIRRKNTDLLVVEADFARRNGTAQRAVDSLWEGLRPHPYSAEQIANSLSALMQLFDSFGDYPLGEGRDLLAEAQRLMVDPVEIEMGISGGGGTRAYVASSELWGALSDSSRSRLGLERPIEGSALMAILGRFYGATLPLFSTPKFTDLFAFSIVPWQIATQRTLVCFSPFHLTSLGIP